VTVGGRDLSLEDVSHVFEHSPWVASEAWAKGPFESVDELHTAMVDVVSVAGRDRQLDLIRAHPELGGPRPAELTAASAQEQARVGIYRLGPDELASLRSLNAAYRERFGFPLIVCVREHTPASILSWGHERLGHSPDEEIEIALGEIAKISRGRLEELQAMGSREVHE
jgi:OHCU decarboxylase